MSRSPRPWRRAALAETGRAGLEPAACARQPSLESHATGNTATTLRYPTHGSPHPIHRRPSLPSTAFSPFPPPKLTRPLRIRTRRLDRDQRAEAGLTEEKSRCSGRRRQARAVPVRLEATESSLVQRFKPPLLRRTRSRVLSLLQRLHLHQVAAHTAAAAWLGRLQARVLLRGQRMTRRHQRRLGA